MIAIALSALVAATVPWGAGGPSNGEDLRVTYVTVGPGDDVTELFGHAVLIVEDMRLNQSRLYNFGEFSFDSTVVVRYALGHVSFTIGERDVDETLARYRRNNRSEHLQELALDPAQRSALARDLAENALPANRNYRYDHFTDNCSTRPRDAIDRALGGLLRANVRPARMTLREHVRRDTATRPAFSVFIDFLMNDSVDGRITTWEEAFLPGELESQLRAAGVVARESTPFEGTRAPPLERAPSLEPWLVLIGLATGGIAIALSTRKRLLALYAAVVALVIGVPGTILCAMWLVTDHVVMHRNENLLLANPLTLCTIPLAIATALGRSSSSGRLRTLWILLGTSAVAALVLKALPWSHQENGRILALLGPAVLGVALAFVLGAGPGRARGWPKHDGHRDRAS